MNYKDMTRPNIDKTVYIGEASDGSIHCMIKFKEDKLSISGVIGAKLNGDCTGSCGQIDTTIKKELDTIEYAENWDKIKAFTFLEHWENWHLNDLTAGNPQQEVFVNEYKKSNKYDYEEVCEAMKKAGIYESNGYKYGTKWLSVEVPTKVIEFLKHLPEATRSCKWKD